MAMQRAQDKIAQMQARAGAVDELLASGALTDLSGSSDPLQAELDKTSQCDQVELELAQLKGQLAVGTPTALGAPAQAARCPRRGAAPPPPAAPAGSPGTAPSRPPQAALRPAPRRPPPARLRGDPSEGDPPRLPTTAVPDRRPPSRQPQPAAALAGTTPPTASSSTSRREPEPVLPRDGGGQ